MSSRSLGGALARTADDAGLPNWGLRLAVGVLLVLFSGVLAAWGWWEFYDSRDARGMRYLEAEIREGRGCFVSGDWTHIDQDTGLVVANWDRRTIVPDADLTYYSSWRYVPCFDDWNEVVRRRLQAGESCGPRFLDRVTTLDRVRSRFETQRGAVLLPRCDLDPAARPARIGAFEAGWFCGGIVLIRDAGATTWPQPVGGLPWPPDGDVSGSWRGSLAGLLSDDGRTLFVRVADERDVELAYYVLDTATGTHLYVFPVPRR